MLSTENSILEEVFPSFLQNAGNRLFIKRDDLIHPEISGNKWRKLKYNLLAAQQQKSDGILTFGGAYSNHLLATAALCKQESLKSIGIVRGEELDSKSNETLKKCEELGMMLVFVSREEYSLRNDELFQKELHIEYPNFMLVPEGGANYLGMIGCQEIWKEIDDHFDYVFVAQGTTTTSLGLLLGCPENTKVIGVPVLKGFDAANEMKQLAKESFIDEEMMEDCLGRFEVANDYHFNGYGKYDDELLSFIDQFHAETDILLDQVYTGKAMYATAKEIERHNWTNKRILFIHTGGLQGRNGIKKG
ncbi:MAG: pyridoxal-phosphate dependent enzyme [Bacteroidota bacterium]